MKEYTYEAEHSWERHRQPVVTDHHHHHQQHPPRQRHQRNQTGDDAAMDADASSMSGMYKHLYVVAPFSIYFKLKLGEKTEEQLVISMIIHRYNVVIVRHMYI